MSTGRGRVFFRATLAGVAAPPAPAAPFSAPWALLSAAVADDELGLDDLLSRSRATLSAGVAKAPPPPRVVRRDRALTVRAFFFVLGGGLACVWGATFCLFLLVSLLLLLLQAVTVVMVMWWS